MFSELFCQDYVDIKGGLGNQLYQLSYANHLRKVQGRKSVHLYFVVRRGGSGDSRDSSKRNLLTALYADVGLETSLIRRYMLKAVLKLSKRFPFFRGRLLKSWVEPEGKHGVYLPEGVLRSVNGGVVYIIGTQDIINHINTSMPILQPRFIVA